MRKRGFIRRFAEMVGLLAVTVFWIGCGDKSTGPESNEPPQIVLNNNEVGVGTDETVTLSATVSDADDDPLTVTWSVTGGESLLASDQGSTTMHWTTPTTVGVATVKAIVSDGQSKRTAVAEFKIGTRMNVNDVGAGTVNWTLSNSPYILDPPDVGGEYRIAVSEGSELNIPAGIEVLMRDDLIFDVAGRLNCRGTSGNPVTFYPNRREPEAGCWVGFRAQTATGATAGMIDMEYTEVAYAVRDIHAIDDSKVYLKNTLLKFASASGLYFQSGGYVKLDSCRVTGNDGNGIWIDGQFAITPDSVVVVNSTISMNGQNGIELNFNDPAGAVPIRINYCEILWNEAYGIDLILPARPRITHNAIYFNDMQKTTAEARRNIVLESPFSAFFTTIDATYNYWLTPDSTVIAGAIQDSADLPQDINVQVVFQPILISWP